MAQATSPIGATSPAIGALASASSRRNWSSASWCSPGVAVMTGPPFRSGPPHSGHAGPAERGDLGVKLVDDGSHVVTVAPVTRDELRDVLESPPGEIERGLRAE